MEEKLAVQHKPWTGYAIEFPTLPKLLVHGREECPRILFLCPETEANPTELCLALFGRQIVMQRLRPGESPGSLASARFAFCYAPEIPVDLPRILAPYKALPDVPVLVAWKSNVVKTARFVTEFLSRPARGNAVRGWEETDTPQEAAPALDGGSTEKVSEDAIWTDPLPRIELVDESGNLVVASTELQDYRAEYACRYVLAHFQENINRDRMAEMVNLSPGYFSNLFRAEVGMSFSDYLIQVRIENAKSLLRRFELSVEAISKRCGFNSLAHFSRTFKDRCGLSPLKYRKSPHLGT